MNNGNKKTSAASDTKPDGPPDLSQGIALAELEQNKPKAATLAGQDVVLVRVGEQVFALGGKCSHFGLPLAQGQVVSGALMCPFHHASFDLKSGLAVRAPGLDSVPCYTTHIRDGVVWVDKGARSQQPSTAKAHPPSVTIVGAGAAGYATVVGLRRGGYKGPIYVVGADTQRPYDRIKLSKGYLAGQVDADKLPLNTQTLTEDPSTHWQVATEVKKIDLVARVLHTSGKKLPFHTLVLATGATPRRLDIPGSKLPHVLVLRQLDDAKQVVALAKKAKKVVIVGASFIGLEAASSLVKRGLHVTVVAPDTQAPMSKVLGPEVGEVIAQAHAQGGTHLVLGRQVTAIEPTSVTLDNGTHLPADMVITAIGVAPNQQLAQDAGLVCSDGVHVDTALSTSAKDIFAAGDVAAMKSAHDGARERIEHWAVAQQMGLVVAGQILGHATQMPKTPFFWTDHYDIKVRYVGHAKKVSKTQVFGDVAQRRFAVALFEGTKVRAVVTVGRDDLALAAHEMLENDRHLDYASVLAG